MKPSQEIAELAIYFEGMADAMATQPPVGLPPDAHSRFPVFRQTPAQRVLVASKWLRKLAGEVCGQGYVCRGGDNCGSDHK